ncbi:MAG: hypothetical protein EPN94_05040 [Nitrospirae bacterium]|nr:MAG: hypothetical protein EPN94_05040 [Nitrospirota bacterium]
MKHFKLTFILLFTLLLLTTPVHAADFEATVTRVIDGDTFKFKTYLLDVTISGACRMKNYNAPETHGAEKPQGLKAKQYLIDLIGDKPVKISASRKDKYGRWLCEAPEIDKEMIEYLKDYPGRDKYIVRKAP